MPSVRCAQRTLRSVKRSLAEDGSACGAELGNLSRLGAAPGGAQLPLRASLLFLTYNGQAEPAKKGARTLQPDDCERGFRADSKLMLCLTAAFRRKGGHPNITPSMQPIVESLRKTCLFIF